MRISILKLFLNIFIFPLFFNVSIGQKKIHVGAKAEYLKAKTVLMHQPSKELFLGVIHPDAALFEDYFSTYKAKREHKKYQKLLSSKGIKVLTIRNILLENTVDKKSNIINGEELCNLREFAAKFLKISFDTSQIYTQEEAKIQDEYVLSTIGKMHPFELVDIILQQPTIILKKTKNNTFYTADYLLNPVMNLYFLRDQMITTANGVVIGKLNSEQREVETQIVEFCLKKIGITPLHKITGDNAFLEGGDFIPAGNVAFIGNGIRTNQLAIEQLLQEKILGVKKLVVIKDNWRNQSEMHLDTYFNIINKNLVVLSEERKNAKKGSKFYLKADVYKLSKEGYKKIESDIDFVKYLRKKLSFKILTISNEDQANYGINFLTIAPNEIVAIKGQSRKYHRDLKNAGVRVHWIDFSNLKLGYGATHCTTQVLWRK